MGFLIRILIVLSLFIFLDIYGYRTLILFSKKRIIKVGYIFFHLLLFVIAIGSFLLNYNKHLEVYESYSMTMLSVIYIPKIILFIFILLEDIFRIIKLISNKITSKNFNLKRSFLLSKISLGLVGLIFIYLLGGLFYGRDNFIVKNVNLEFNNLPKEFDGIRVVQISDLHLGSFGGSEKLDKIVKLINKENPDIVFFTGDIVNQTSKELTLAYQKSFSKINSKMGKYSILGNHDYGNYAKWNNETEKIRNLQNIEDFFRKTGFTHLSNSNISLKIDTSYIYILGSENFSKGQKLEKGDLNKATFGVPKNEFKILLTHDPYHFDSEVIDYPSEINLTLSGHNHGMQMGINLFGKLYSPTFLLKKRTMGFYKEKNKYLYINNGLGVSSVFLLRAGVYPEITTFTLSRKKSN